MITIYGSPQSSSGRCFWCLEEVGVKYDVKPINFKEKEHKSAEYLTINPNGKVPALTDDDFVIWESMAINFYLAEAYKPELLGKDIKSRGLVYQWSIWSIADLQGPLVDMLIQTVFVPEAHRDVKLIEKAKAKIPQLLEVLNTSLENKNYLVDDEFSLADLNVASVVNICSAIKFDLNNFVNIQAWLGKTSERPSFQRYMSKS